MSNNQWQVVGKPKKEKALNKKQDEKKKVENGPKVEDFLKSAQMKSLYSSVNMNHKQENKATKEKAKEPAPKKPQQQQHQQPKKQPVKSNKPSKPKSIEWIAQQLNTIPPSQLRESYDFGQQQFNPVVRLTNLAAFINNKIPYETDLEVNLSKAIPNKVRNMLNQILTDAGQKNLAPFLEICLSTMANNIKKGSPTFGYRLFVELLITSNPRILLSSLKKIDELRNSYQNTKNVGVSLLWCLSLAAEKNFQVGFEVFQAVVNKMLDLKNYTPQSVNYLKALICRKIEKGTKTQSQLVFFYFLVLNINKVNLPKEVVKDLTTINNELRKKIFERKDEEFSTFFQMLLKELETNKTLSSNVKNELIALCAQCVAVDAAVLKLWTQNYNKYMPITESILVHMDNNWPKLQATIDKKTLRSCLESFVKMAAKKSDKKLDQAVKSSQKIIKKMTVTRSFPWKTVIFLLIVAIGGVVFYDIKLHGSYENSQVGKFLKSSGIQQHAQTGLKYTIVYTKKGLVWGQENIPVYYGVTKNFLAPYGELARDLFAFSANVFRDLKDYVVERIPVVTSFIESYAPGLIDKIVEGSVFIWTKLGEYFEIVRNYLATNVFVGQLSPDNLHKVTLQAINTTQVYAIQYYDWLSQKVQMLSDVK